MELQFYGANCIKITTKKATIVVDDYLAHLGGKNVSGPGDIQLITNPSLVSLLSGDNFRISSPGEYEVADVEVQGIAAQSYSSDSTFKNSVIYRIVSDDIRLAIVGHVTPELDGLQLEALGPIDVLFVPVGGGDTLGGADVLRLIKKIEPKILIPSYYSEAGLKYAPPQQDLAEALKQMALEPTEPVARLKIKPTDLLDGMKLVILERQK